MKRGKNEDRQRLRSLAALAALLTAALSCVRTGVRPEVHERELLRLHQNALQAHIESNIDLLLEAESDEYILVNRGEVTHPTREQRRAVLGPYLSRTRFSVYRDLVPPSARVSEDASLGWVVTQVEARGEQTAADGTVQPLEFVSAWIELYERRNGQWLRIGNVSNFKSSE